MEALAVFVLLLTSIGLMFWGAGVMLNCRFLAHSLNIPNSKTLADEAKNGAAFFVIGFVFLLGFVLCLANR